MISKFLKSSLIHSISYDNFKLLVNLTNGHSYLYQNVPYEVYKEFCEAESAGKFYNTRIKSYFPSSKVQ